jgi:hypothetical protein
MSAALAVVSAAGSPPRQPSAARQELADAIERLAEAVREQTAAGRSRGPTRQRTSPRRYWRACSGRHGRT